MYFFIAERQVMIINRREIRKKNEQMYEQREKIDMIRINDKNKKGFAQRALVYKYIVNYYTGKFFQDDA